MALLRWPGCEGNSGAASQAQVEETTWSDQPEPQSKACHVESRESTGECVCGTRAIPPPRQGPSPGPTTMRSHGGQSSQRSRKGNLPTEISLRLDRTQPSRVPAMHPLVRDGMRAGPSHSCVHSLHSPSLRPGRDGRTEQKTGRKREATSSGQTIENALSCSFQLVGRLMAPQSSKSRMTAPLPLPG